MSELILLVTGGRTFKDKAVVATAICDAIGRHYPDGQVPDPFDWSSVTIRHGKAKGADTLAHRIAQTWGMKVQFIEADWVTFGRGAGPIRNSRLVAMEPKADECLAFPTQGSRGTWDCVRKAAAAGIPVRNHGVGQAQS